MKLNKLAISFIFVLVGLYAYGQPGLTKEVQVTGAYDPIISDAEKIALPAEMPDSLLNIKGKFQYSITEKAEMPGFEVRAIPAAKISGSSYEDPHMFYARLGAGYPLRFLGDLYINNLRPDNLSAGLFYNHRSIWTKVDNGAEEVPIDEMNHTGGIFLRKYWNKVTLGVEGGFSQHNVLFYGYDTDIRKFRNYNFNKDSLLQSYMSFFVAVGVKSNDYNADDLRYKAGFIADFFGDRGNKKFDIGRMFATNEDKIGGTIYIGKPFSEGTHSINLNADFYTYMRRVQFNNLYNTYNVNQRILFGSVYSKLYGTYGDGKNLSDNRMILNISPSYSYSAEKVSVNIGIKYTGFDNGKEFKSKVFPVAGVEFKLMEEFVPYASIDGGIDMNDYKSLVKKNPYLMPGLSMTALPTENTFMIQAGFKGAINKQFSYNVYGKYEQLKNRMYFINSVQPLLDTTSGAVLYSLKNNFDVLYDDIQYFNVGAELQYSQGNIKSALAAKYNHEVIGDLPTVYNIPQFEVDFDFDVTLIKYLILNFNARAQSALTYGHNKITKEDYETKGFVDLGLGAEYIINRNFSAFISLNNLLNNKYEIWHQYKVPGVGALAGITLKF